MCASTLPSRESARENGLWWKAALLLLSGLFIYAPVFHGGWLMDDNLEITENPFVQNPAALPAIWRGESGADYLPLKTTVEWLLWRGFGGQPAAYHGTSVVLHLGCALLFWRLLARLGVRQAWLGGLLFVAHPICVESVAWISELKNTLSLALLLLAMLAWLSFDERGRRQDYAWSLAWFAAALLCKSAVIMWPAVIPLYAWWRRGEVRRGDWIGSLPFFALAVGAASATIALQNARAIRTENYPLGGVASHLALAGSDIAFYFWKTVFPFGLLPMYPRWPIDPPAPGDFLPWLLAAGLSVWLWTKRHRAWCPTVVFGLGFFLINLFPVLGFFRMSYMRISWVADHFAYVPSLGIIGLAAAGLGALYQRLGLVPQTRLRVAGGIAFAILTMTSRLHAEVYTSLVAMSRYTLERNPGSWMAHQLYASAAQRQGDFDTALVQAQQAVRLNPDVAETQNSLGLALDAKGRFQASLEHLEQAHRLAPGNLAILENLAKCQAQAEQYASALRNFRELLQHRPQDAVLHANTGACLFGLGQMDAAIAQFQQALALNPQLQSVRQNLALARRQRDRQPPPPPGPETP